MPEPRLYKLPEEVSSQTLKKLLDMLISGIHFTKKQEELIRSEYENWDSAKALFRNLNERQVSVIVLRYGLGSDHPLSQRDVAVYHGMSKSGLRNVQQAAVKVLRYNLRKALDRQ